MNVSNIEELEQLAALLHEITPQVKEITHMLELMKELGLSAESVLIPPIADRFIERGDVAKILKVSPSTVSKLVQQGTLTPLYIAGSQNAKFRLSQVLEVPKP